MQNKQESHDCDSPDHQGASTIIIHELAKIEGSCNQQCSVLLQKSTPFWGLTDK
jgi:hypothetical protein